MPLPGAVTDAVGAGRPEIWAAADESAVAEDKHAAVPCRQRSGSLKEAVRDGRRIPPLRRAAGKDALDPFARPDRLGAKASVYLLLLMDAPVNPISLQNVNGLLTVLVRRVIP